MNVLYIGPAYCLSTISKILGDPYKVLYFDGQSERFGEVLSNCDVLFDASMRYPLTAEIIGNATDLKLVVTATTGSTHIDSRSLDARGIPLLTLHGHNELLRELTPAAEHTWALIMASARHIKSAVQHVDLGFWERTEFPGLMLKGKTIGIIGLGRIGSWVARYAHAFGMKVIATDSSTLTPNEHVEMVEVGTLVERSDIITVHVPVSESNRGFINRDLIETFKTGCIFINTSRSELVDEVALVSAMERGLIAAIGVDVLHGEPDINQSPLWQYSKRANNVIITPHIGGYCPDAVKIVTSYTANRILNYFGVDLNR